MSFRTLHAIVYYVKRQMKLKVLTLGRASIGRTSLLAVGVTCPSGHALAREAPDLVGATRTRTTGSTAALIQISALKWFNYTFSKMSTNSTLSTATYVPFI